MVKLLIPEELRILGTRNTHIEGQGTQPIDFNRINIQAASVPHLPINFTNGQRPEEDVGFKEASFFLEKIT